MREHWREPGYWWWLWRSAVPGEAKMAAGVLLVAALIAGGWFAADRLTAAQAQVASTGDIVLETTVQKVVTVREHGKVVRKTVPVVRKVVVQSPGSTATATAYEVSTNVRTQVVTTPAQVRVVRHVVKALVPVVKKQVVTVNGKEHTVVRTRYVPTTRVQTQTQVLTNVVTNRQTVTNAQTLTAPPTTVRTTSTTTTTKTTTLPPVTSTQVVTTTQTVHDTTTETVTTTDTVTATDTVTTTEPAPPPVTITVTCPTC